MTTLLVANNGGHLMQLHSLAPRLDVEPDRLWVTVPTPQSRSVLAGEQVHWVDPAPTRDLRAAVRNAELVTCLFRRHKVTAAVSTGSSLAVSVLPQARARGIPAYYIESATRVHGPSVSGRLLRAVPGMHLYTQHRAWAGGCWHYGGSVLDGFSARTGNPAPVVRKVVVSLGTSEVFGFRRLLQRLVRLIPRDVDVLWQTGSTDTSGLDVDARRSVPAAELHRAMAQADLVVAHAGTGVALAALEAGRLPLLVPRRPEHHEHVDDHQLQIAHDLEARGLALVREVDELTCDDLLVAASTVVGRNGSPPSFLW